MKSACTPARGNRQVHWNTVWEELEAKAHAALEDDEKSAIYARRKVEVESVFGHIKGNRSFRRFSLRGLDKVHTEYGIVAMAHNLLKVASIRLAAFLETLWNKNGRKTILAFRPLFHLGTFQTAPFFMFRMFRGRTTGYPEGDSLRWRTAPKSGASPSFWACQAWKRRIYGLPTHIMYQT